MPSPADLVDLAGAVGILAGGAALVLRHAGPLRRVGLGLLFVGLLGIALNVDPVVDGWGDPNLWLQAALGLPAVGFLVASGTDVRRQRLFTVAALVGVLVAATFLLEDLAARWDLYVVTGRGFLLRSLLAGALAAALLLAIQGLPRSGMAARATVWALAALVGLRLGRFAVQFGPPESWTYLAAAAVIAATWLWEGGPSGAARSRDAALLVPATFAYGYFTEPWLRDGSPGPVGLLVGSILTVAVLKGRQLQRDLPPRTHGALRPTR